MQGIPMRECREVLVGEKAFGSLRSVRSQYAGSSGERVLRSHG